MDTEAQSAPETVTESDDVHADVRAAMEALSNPQPTEEAPKAERTRNELGQFAKADVAPEIEQPKIPDADPVQDKPVKVSSPVEPPKSWSADAITEWSKLSPAVQQAVLKRESEMNEGGQRWSEEKRRYEETLAPVREVAQRNGVDERTGLQRLLAANDYLERDPVSAIQWLANAYGVNLGNIEQTHDRPQVDPVLSQLHNRLSSIENTFHQSEAEKTQSAIDAFANAPGHEHFADVKVFMGHLLSTGQATDMQDAYDKATWATPSVREKLIAAQTADQQAQRAAKEREAAEKARRGAISVNGSPSLGATPAPKRDYETVEDAVRAAYAAHSGH